MMLKCRPVLRCVPAVVGLRGQASTSMTPEMPPGDFQPQPYTVKDSLSLSLFLSFSLSLPLSPSLSLPPLPPCVISDIMSNQFAFGYSYLFLKKVHNNNCSSGCVPGTYDGIKEEVCQSWICSILQETTSSPPGIGNPMHVQVRRMYICRHYMK